MKKNYTFLLFMLIVFICNSQNINTSNTGYIEQVKYNINKAEAFDKTKKWGEKRFKSSSSEFVVANDEIKAKGSFTMPFKTGNLDFNYVFTYDLSILSKESMLIVELIPKTVGMDNTQDKLIYECLIVEKPLNEEDFKIFSAKYIIFSTGLSEKKAMKMVTKQFKRAYSDYLVNKTNFDNEIKYIFDSLKKSVSTS